MSRLHVSLLALEELVEQMASFDHAVELRSERADELARALSGTWTGTAAGSYASAHAMCVRDLAGMRSVVSRLRANLATAHANYSAALAANARMWP